MELSLFHRCLDVDADCKDAEKMLRHARETGGRKWFNEGRLSPGQGPRLQSAAA